jgi:hypothetical protein
MYLYEDLPPHTKPSIAFLYLKREERERARERERERERERLDNAGWIHI